MEHYSYRKLYMGSISYAFGYNYFNSKNVYGVAGSYAATFADEYGFPFFYSSSNTPSPVKCEPPTPETDTTDAITETEPITTEPSTETSGDFETQNIPIFVDEGQKNSDDGGIPVVVVIIAVVSFIAIAAIIIIILAVNKKRKIKIEINIGLIA